MGLEARVCGGSSHLSLCKHIQVARVRAQTPSESCIWPDGLRDPCRHARTRVHTHKDTHIQQQAPSGTHRSTCSPTLPTPRFWSPCILSEYCQRLGQRGGQTPAPQRA